MHNAAWKGSSFVTQCTNLTVTEIESQSGLTQACMTSPHTREYVEKAVLEYIKKWVPEKRTAVLAGNSVHADRSFLVEEMPDVIDWLHYRWLLSSDPCAHYSDVCGRIVGEWCHFFNHIHNGWRESPDVSSIKVRYPCDHESQLTFSRNYAADGI